MVYAHNLASCNDTGSKLMRYEAQFTQTTQDVLAGWRMFNRWPNDFLKLSAFGAVTAAVIFAVAGFVLHAWILGIGGVWIGAAIFGIPWFLEWRVRLNAEKFKPEEVKVSFTDDGIEMSNHVMQTKKTWKEIKIAGLDERGILLEFRSDSFSIFIPARAFIGGYFPLKELKILAKKTAP